MLADEQTLQETAGRLAIDIGGANQAGCASSRVTFVVAGDREDAVERVTELGRMTYDAIMALPSTFSSKPKAYDKDLKSHVDALRWDDEWFEVIGGEEDEGAIIISKLPRQVDFAAYLADRTANLVPVKQSTTCCSASMHIRRRWVSGPKVTSRNWRISCRCTARSDWSPSATPCTTDHYWGCLTMAFSQSAACANGSSTRSLPASQTAPRSADSPDPGPSANCNTLADWVLSVNNVVQILSLALPVQLVCAGSAGAGNPVR